MGVTSPEGKEPFIAAVFPSACGKTLAMLKPTLPGWKVHCLGDDIAWMKFGEDGRLYAAGFFGVAPGTSKKTNPMAVEAFQKNSIFTNVAETSEGKVYWEGLEDEIRGRDDVTVTDWMGQPWKLGNSTPAAHPNSRFCAPAKQCPIIHPDWESPNGVPIDAIVLGGRRPQGVPLVFVALFLGFFLVDVSSAGGNCSELEKDAIADKIKLDLYGIGTVFVLSFCALIIAAAALLVTIIVGVWDFLRRISKAESAIEKLEKKSGSYEKDLKKIFGRFDQMDVSLSEIRMELFVSKAAGSKKPTSA